MIKFVLANVTLPEPGHHHMETIRDLSYEEMSQFSKAQQSLGAFDLTYSLVEICEENYHAIEDYYKELCAFRCGNQLDFHKIIIKWITLTLNYLASYRSFIDHYETTLNRTDDPVNSTYKKFKDRTALHYDSHFAYRFLWNLRNYIQHCGLPACEWNFSEITEGSDKGKARVEIAYLRDGLLQDFDWRKLKAEIESQPPKIDVMLLIRELHSSISDISRFVSILNFEKLQEHYYYLDNLLNEAISKNQRNPSPVVLELEINEGSNPMFREIVLFPLRIMTNIRSLFLEKDQR
jgi:hypothetical protein